MNMTQWAIRWGVPMVALQELHEQLMPTTELDDGKSETAVQAALRVEFSQLGGRLYRNNVGALQDQRGTWVRYGLANESKRMNQEIKSADLIGCRPVLITPAHVGTTVGVFTSREAKHSGWRFSGTEHELAQLKWAQIIGSLGGDAKFATGPGSFA